MVNGLEKACALGWAIGWRGEKSFTQNVAFQDEKRESLRQFAAEVRFAGAGQAANHNKDRFNYRLGKRSQTFPESLCISNHLGLGHTLIIECFTLLR